MQYRNILFPVDFSPRAHACVPHVTSMAQRFGASLTLLHVLEMPTPWFTGMEAPVLPEIDWDQLETEASARLRDFAQTAFPDVKPKTVILNGFPAETVSEYVKADNIDLVMLPSHGRGLFRAALLGSVTAKVLHDTDCAVWTDAHLPDRCAAHDPELRSILCAIDLSPESAELIAGAASLHRQFGATVRLVHAVPGPDAGPARYIDHEFARFLEDHARSSIAELQLESGTSFDVCLGSGSAPRIIAAAVDHHQADLVIIGRGHLKGTAGRFRTHAYGIIREAGCPVLSL